MTSGSPDIPTLWDDKNNYRLNCIHCMSDVRIEVKGISNGVKKVKEGEKVSGNKENKWKVVASHGEKELRHGERKDTEAEAEELAVEFMIEFNENYDGDAHEAYIETLKSR